MPSVTFSDKVIDSRPFIISEITINTSDYRMADMLVERLIREFAHVPVYMNMPPNNAAKLFILIRTKARVDNTHIYMITEYL